MELKEAGSSLDSLISSFNAQMKELQELVIGRNMYPATSIPDLLAVDAAVKAMELQVQAISDRLREEAEAIPKAKRLIELSLGQQKRLQNMLAHVPTQIPQIQVQTYRNPSVCKTLDATVHDLTSGFGPVKIEEEPTAAPHKGKKGCSSAPIWHISADELDSLSSYMRGRLTLDKINAAINDMAAYADANAQLIALPKKKLAEDSWEKALELRDIATSETIRGKHFFLETDVKGPSLKLDNTGKAILTVLRHIGRIHETRIGHNRVFILSRPQ
ncbi:hypothetical protein Syun_012533 [Stephania yunnanensis]|uniref:SKA complex subunit 1 homolog n=1 Tax=Stephania yunnanensis TaxID=152371 RepID=A0AAP0K0Z8_9MAGN